MESCVVPFPRVYRERRNSFHDPTKFVFRKPSSRGCRTGMAHGRLEETGENQMFRELYVLKLPRLNARESAEHGRIIAEWLSCPFVHPLILAVETQKAVLDREMF